MSPRMGNDRKMIDKALIQSQLQALLTVSDEALDKTAEAILSDDVVFDVAHPVNQLVGRQAVLDGFYRPLRAALSSVRRRDEIFISAQNRRDFGGEWISSVVH